MANLSKRQISYFFCFLTVIITAYNSYARIDMPTMHLERMDRYVNIFPYHPIEHGLITMFDNRVWNEANGIRRSSDPRNDGILGFDRQAVWPELALAYSVVCFGGAFDLVVDCW
ncbi:hypothetical protein SISNIDRAFT_471726 [Sistotremastrum niveocremeum HHB9708]|uniref:Uncharacterized protein n=1 Tax=Sistotremastrum niveocremeum HHB9708 TaxID=1314777 RepID=A0A164MAL4_9AGAM|nr:hypothetical protein SISNIDRAFT_471726 [Sistotremastrum niveocremeum HHB9708]